MYFGKRRDVDRVRGVQMLSKYVSLVHPSPQELEKVLEGAPFTDKTKEFYRLTSHYDNIMKGSDLRSSDMDKED